MNTTQPPVADAGPRPRLSARAAGLTSSAIRDLLAHARRPGMISFAGGLPAAAMFDLEGLHAATAAVLETGVDVFQYGATEGQDDLRQALARLMGERGAPVEASRVLVTSGSQQALDLVVRSLLDPGATVVVERPSYLAALQVLHLAQARVVAVDVDADGLCVERLDAACAGLAPRLAYVVPTFANPSGACLSLARRLALLEWAVRHDVWLIEDDPYGELRFGGEPLPSLLALAPRVPGAAARVIHVCSLSKVVAPALRIGWTVLPEALVGPVTRVKQSLDLQTSALTQEIAARYLGSGRLPTRVAAIARAYGARKRALADALHRHFGDRIGFNDPDGGMFLWARFEDGTDAAALLPVALDHGVMYVPGEPFFADAPDRSSLRLAFSTVGEARCAEGVARLARAARTPGACASL